MGLAKCYFMSEDINKTIETCDFALAADDKYGEAYAYKAHSFFYLNNPDSAIENYEKAIEYKAIPPELGYMFMGMSYATKEDWEKTEECCNQVIRIFEENGDSGSILLIDTYTTKANAVAKMGRYKEAHQLCKKAKEINPDEGLIFLTEGKVYLEEDIEKKATQAFKKAAKTSTGPEMWYMIGTAYSEHNYMYEAKENYEKAYKINPKYEDLPERLSVISIMTDDLDGFLKYNKDCERPFREETIQQLLNGPDHRKEDEPILKEIMKRLKEEKENNKSN